MTGSMIKFGKKYIYLSSLCSANFCMCSIVGEIVGMPFCGQRSLLILE